jgi:uncharacterized protein YqeY
MSLVDTLRKKALEAMKAKDTVATTILRLAQPRFRSWSEATDSERMHSERPLRVRPTGA